MVVREGLRRQESYSDSEGLFNSYQKGTSAETSSKDITTNDK